MEYRECAAYLRERDNFLIITHIRPDGDTLGSAAALCSALRRMGKNAAMFPNPEITPRYLKYVEKYIEADFEYDYIVAVDVAEEHMFCKGFDAKVNLAIDHHPSNSHYADELLLHAEKASCGESIIEVIKELNGGLSTEEASLLYMAVSTDCGCFRYANVTAETFAAASELAKYGAEIQKLNFELFRQVSKARIVLEGMICAGMKFYRDGKLVIATVTLDMMEKAGASENDCDDIAGIPGKVEGCVVSMVIRELEKGKCKVSVRSQPSFNSCEFCAKFGGGGHEMASGCTIMAEPDEVCEMLVKAVEDI